MRMDSKLVALALAAWLTCGSAASGESSPTAPLPGDSVYQLPVKLTDQDGKERLWRSYRGKPRLASMFYASCQYVCPLIVDAGKAVERNLTPAQQERLGIVLISMDSARDTPAALKNMAETRKLDPARWSLARPSAGDVRAIAGVLGIRYRALADGEFNHTSTLVLLDPDGRVLAAINA